MKKKKNIILSVVILFIILVCVFIAINKLNKSTSLKFNKVREDVTVFGVLGSYSDYGMLSADNGVIKFSDAKAGNSTVLCDKPSCKHNTESCNAFVGQTDLVAIYNNKLYFIQSVEGEKTLSKFLFEADINGSNRKRIAEIENTTAIYKAKFVEGKLLLITLNQYKDAESLEQAETIAYRALCIDLVRNKIDYITDIEEDKTTSTLIDQIEYIKKDNKILYTKVKSIKNEKADQKDSNDSELLKNIRNEFKNTATELYSYNIDTKESTHINTFQSSFINTIVENKVFIVKMATENEPQDVFFTRAYVYDFSTNEERDTEIFHYGIFYKNKDYIFTSAGEGDKCAFYSFNIKSGKFNKITSIKDGFLLGLSSNYIYINMKNKDNQDWVYSVEIKDFLKGNLSSAKALQKSFTD